MTEPQFALELRWACSHTFTTHFATSATMNASAALDQVGNTAITGTIGRLHCASAAATQRVMVYRPRFLGH